MYLGVREDRKARGEGASRISAQCTIDARMFNGRQFPKVDLIEGLGPDSASYPHMSDQQGLWTLLVNQIDAPPLPGTPPSASVRTLYIPHM
ncbi:uncharacterized protein N7477_000510 [Penicillium maclennaniae]|uniref:uncharacterized protein n=1 Tax=Penicillium maclennaniae TaxID=1343394 RepID=UPI0025404035|nr:uncharacterized protein N7477_000510 [Penicillium maclennaniae]KAJ5684165.1 hypothetical protein N7477_000510 [Penicillium maclennaniae]